MQDVWKIQVSAQTTDVDLERCIAAAERTSDVNVHRVAAVARVERQRRRDSSELAVAKKRIVELEALNARLQSQVTDSSSASVWTRWQTIAGWVAAAIAFVALFMR